MAGSPTFPEHLGKVGGVGVDNENLVTGVVM